MAFPEIRTYEFDENPAGTLPLGPGHAHDVRQLSEKGYQFETAVGCLAVFTLEGSVAGNIWSTIQAGLGAADAQGVIPAQYNYVRANGTNAGVLNGAGLKFAGKVL